MRTKTCLSAVLAILGASGCGLYEKISGHFGKQPQVPPTPTAHQPRAWPQHEARPMPHINEPDPSVSPPGAVAGLAPAVHVAADQFVDDAGNPVHLHGFSWFGFNDGTDALGGLWSNDPLADFATTVYRQKLLGFNAVRLPFSFAAFNREPKKVVHACADLSDEDIIRATLSEDAKDADLRNAPKLPLPPKREPGQCNGYLEGNTVREQLLWTTQFYVNQGFYVLLDNHYREDPTVEQDQKGWEQAWADLAHDVLSKPNMVGRVFFDILNEPDQYGQMWEPTQKVGLKTLYIAAMDAIDAKSDKAIYFLEGTGHSALRCNWGDGYCTDADQIQQKRVSDIRPFLTALAQKPYRNRVVLTPHVYGPAVTYATQDFSGKGLFSRLNASFGTLTKTPFEAAGQKLVFPVAIGEFGSHFTDSGDKSFMQDFASYLKNDGAGKDDLHNAIPNWFYWCWNVNSGDTGGLVKDDWKTLEWEKLKYLEGLGLTPWHRQKAATPGSAPTPAPAPVSAPSPAPATPAAPASQPVGPGPSKPAVVYETSDPAKQPSMPPPQQPAPGPSVQQASGAGLAAKDGKVHVKVLYNSQWESEGKQHFVYNLHLTNSSGEEIRTPFDVEMTGPKFTELGESWNLSEARIDGNKVMAKVTASWASLPPDNLGTTNVGFIGVSQDAEGKLTALRVNGKDAVIEN